LPEFVSARTDSACAEDKAKAGEEPSPQLPGPVGRTAPLENVHGRTTVALTESATRVEAKAKAGEAIRIEAPARTAPACLNCPYFARFILHPCWVRDGRASARDRLFQPGTIERYK
jgi:hypothetical protein